MTLMDKPEEFLIEEYKNLFAVEAARNERLDRFLTLFLSLVAAPWALYAIVIKDRGTFSLSEMPRLIACVFLLVSVLGFLLVIMYIQTRFILVDYMRAVNAIRNYFATASTIESALILPRAKNRPFYYERQSYTFFAVLAMALVNSGHLGLALYSFLGSHLIVKWAAAALSFLIWLGLHWYYFREQATKREARRAITGGMGFGESAVPAPSSEITPVEPPSLKQ